MKSRPVLFNGAMVRAILAGTKTQTRRPVTANIGFLGGSGQQNDPDCWGWAFDGKQGHGYEVLGRGHRWRNNHDLNSMAHPHGEAGDELWVRESFQEFPALAGAPAGIGYMADLDRCGQVPVGGKFFRTPREWTPSIHMPRGASRIALAVLDATVQRLQDTTEDDARAEGFERIDSAATWLCVPKDGGLGAFEQFVEPDEEQREELAFFRRNTDSVLRTALEGFRLTWRDIYGKKSGLAWNDNPWVWVTKFELKAQVGK